VPNRRPFYVSFVPGIAQLGKGGAAGMAALAATMIPAEAMESWGWRIPFLLAVPLGILCLVMRMRIEDSPEFTAAKEHDTTTTSPFKKLLAEHRAPLAKVMAIATVQNVGTYIGTVFIATYLSVMLGFSKAQASTIVLLAVLAASVLIPLAGILGSHIGPRKLLMASYVAYAVLTIPSFLLMGQGSFAIALAGLILGILPYALCQAGTYSGITEFFPVQVRHTGVAFGHSVGAVLGGSAGPYAATWLIDQTDNNLMPAFLLVAFGLIGLAVVGLTVRTNTAGAHRYR
jgi:MFS transporter, MHS family, proline/betaine transporter